ncbi:MAG: carboxylating nicotinate-nucleotide diphosphorylase [Alphaproteobacteria bacterium]
MTLTLATTADSAQPTGAIPSLPDAVLKPLVDAALAEDLGMAGDITTTATIAEETEITAHLTARADGVVAGMDLARFAFTAMDAGLQINIACTDGTRVKAGEVLATISGKARSILSAERVALNFLTHLSGIATATAQAVAEAASTGSATRIAATRKTTPGLRAVEKQAVIAGGGTPHRYGLFDAVMIKDNHIAACGSIADAIHSARAHIGHTVKIEVEVDHLNQIPEALEAGADILLLDNMTPDQIRSALKLIDGRAVTEASGSIRGGRIAAYAKTGVDLISLGYITHSAPQLDIGLDL